MRFPRASDYIRDEAVNGTFSVHPDVFTDPGIFDLEQRHIFRSTWSFLTLESEVGRPNDFITTHIGNTPILVTRDKQGRVNAFLNACRHKGALVCVEQQGNTPLHVCPYHAWSYDAGGKLRSIRDASAAGYTDRFRNLDHNLIALPKVEAYRGFVFGSLSADVPPLSDFLGDMRFFLDLIVDRYPGGLRYLPGSTVYTYRANWKLQMENGMDSYHLNTAHSTFIDVMDRRARGEGNVAVREVSWRKRENLQQGSLTFDHGHTVLWVDEGDTEGRPDYIAAERARPRVGDVKADWMRRGRNYYLFPNMQIQDSQSLMIRIFRPIGVGLTEMTAFCLAPVDEEPAMRNWRLRQYEDFFNPSGLATPDDSVVYEHCQQGMGSVGLPWLQGYSRGTRDFIFGGNALSEEVGLHPATTTIGPMGAFVEVLMQQPYRAWSTMIDKGVEQDLRSAASC
ncbi:aromatic ring-hydroxylating oxygenase subunit alpha [Sphingobium sp.]|uniref:aromatic ring-hydroxylating oxygenase subunit alpha n=1 Tax=Sphingobium sp. TaxID=1912891 RepID=UPI0028BEE117|nr:SRPBCC family protein [Sphingobium sp.]